MATALISVLLLSLPATLLSTPLPDPSPSTNQFDFPIYKLAKKDLDFTEVLETRIRQHQSLLIKYQVDLAEEDDQVVPLKKRAATTGSSFLAGNDLSYYASISLGTPKKTYEVVLDTGSSDLVIALSPSNACGSSCTITAPLYTVAGSSTSKNTGVPVKLTYGTGSASGTVVTDTMSMSGYTAQQAFAACNQISDLTSSDDQVGLMGLGWQSLSASNSTPFIQGLWQTGQLTSPIFGFGLAQLNSAAVPNPTSVVPGGIMTVGGVNTTLFTGTMNWIPLVTESYWTIPLDNVGVAGNSLGISSPNAVIDTGTNAIAVPGSAAAAIYNAIPGSQAISGSGGLYAYPCSTQVSLSLTFGGVAYTMLPADFNTGAANRAGTQCVGAVSSLGSASANQWIVGTPFLMSFYNAYRFSPPAVGFATMADPNSILESLAIPTSGSTTGGTISDSVLGGGAGTGNSISSLLPSSSLPLSTVIASSASTNSGINSSPTVVVVVSIVGNGTSAGTATTTKTSASATPSKAAAVTLKGGMWGTVVAGGLAVLSLIV